jgi:methylmalonyl-CoA/ethylmalonyl-CoA epimerase
MPGKLRHIAITCPDPWKEADFYMKAFGMTKVGETDSTLARGVYVSDGTINIAFLNYKTDWAAGEDRGKDFYGLHHVGFWVDNVEQSKRELEAAGGTYMMGEVPVKGNTFYEVKYRDPMGVVIDITDHGWGGASKEGAPGAAAPGLRHPDLVADRSGLPAKSGAQ